MFCLACADFQLRIIKSDMLNDDTVTTFSGHSNYINSVSWEPEGDYIASVSDDHTVKIWTTKHTDSTDKCIVTFYLSSPGMDASWHSEENGQSYISNYSLYIYHCIYHRFQENC